MKAAVCFALVPALAFCAVLAAVPEAAWAGEDSVMPFPGAAAAGGGTAPEATPAPLAAAAAPAAAGEEAANPEASPVLPETASGPAPVGASVGGGAPESRTRESQPDAPTGGSRLLRALAGMPENGGAAARDGSRAHAAGGCPRALLQRLLAGAAGDADALSALGIEREILTLCRERQEILVGLFETEAALRELRAPPTVPAPEAAAPSTAPGGRIVPAARTAAPSPLRAALADAEKPDEADTRAGDTRAGDPRAGDIPAGEPQGPRYAWFSIVGTAGALRAGVTDGSGVWFVREGDTLPGGTRIAGIAGRPPSVLVTGMGETQGPETLVPETLVLQSGEATPLPYRAWPGDGP